MMAIARTSNQIRTAACPPRVLPLCLSDCRGPSGFGPFSHPFPFPFAFPTSLRDYAVQSPQSRPRGGRRAGKIIGDLVYYITESGGRVGERATDEGAGEIGT